MAAPASRGRLRRVLANAGVLLGGKTVAALLSLAYLALTARALGATGLGVLVLIVAFAEAVGDIVKFQSWQTVLRYGARPLEEGRRQAFQRVLRFSFILDLIGSAAGLLVGVVGAWLLAPLLGWSDNAGAAAAYAVSIIFMSGATPVGVLRLLDRFDLIAAQSAVVSLVRLLGCAAAFAMGGGLEAFLAVWAAGALVGFVVMAGNAVGLLRRRGLLDGFSWTDSSLSGGMPGVWRFAWTTNLNVSLSVAFSHVVTLAVGALLGPAAAALWRIGRQVANALAKPARLLVPALYPELARLHALDDDAAMRRLALQVGVLGGGGATLLLLAAAAFGRPLLGLVMGPAFESAAGAMVWQVAAAVVAIWALPLEPMLVSLGRAGGALKVRLAVSAAFLLLLVPTVERFGLAGAGAAVLSASAALGLGMLLMLRYGRGSAAAPLTAPTPVL